ncbi:MAG: hypothetical protein HYX84_01050 [Chloroflexi bacterium]|nr:hypothetical protein [Chloroflexota bacterium]
MKSKAAFTTAILLALTLVIPSSAQAGPVITLRQPVPPVARFIAGAQNPVSIGASSTGSAITSAEFQVLFNDPAGTFPAMRIGPQRAITPGLAKTGDAVIDSTAVPAGLPSGSVVSLVLFGTVSSVNSTIGEWKIGTPPVAVYERQDGSTSVQGAPVVGSEVRVSAMRTLAAGPVIAETITSLGAGSLPAPAPTVERSFLFNGTIQSVQTASQTAGIKLGGATWTVGGVPFRIDDANFPANIDSGIGLGGGLNPLVTVQFTTQLPATVDANMALEVFSPQISIPVSGVIHPAPVINTEPAPVNLPTGSWKQLVIEGVVSAANPNGEWAIGNPPLFVYQSTNTTVRGAPAVGTEVRVIATRTLAPGPVVAREITALSTTPRIPGKATVSAAYFFNGIVETTDAAVWTIGGAKFVVNDPNEPAVLQSGLNAGSAATVEYRFVGPPGPDTSLWVPMQLNPASNSWNAVITPPAGPDRTGFLFLRATDAQQVVAAMVVPASLSVPPPEDADGGGGGGGGGGPVAPPIITVALTGVATTAALNIDPSGKALSEAKLTTIDGKATLTVAQGTVLQTKDGTPLMSLTAAPLAGTPPAAPPDHSVIVAQDFGPDGATFNPALTVSMTYDPANLPAGINENKLSLAYWDGTGWTKLDSVVDTAARTVTAQVSHFTVVGILAELPAPPPVQAVIPVTAPTPTPITEPAAAPAHEHPVPAPEPAPAALPVPTPEPATTVPPAPAPEGTPTSNRNSIVAIEFTGAVIVLIGLVILYRRKRVNQR